MPLAKLEGLKINYLLEDSEDENAPVLVFSNSLGATLNMWDAQAAALSRNFRVLRYDTRGHGQSSVTHGPYSISQLGRDVLDLLDTLHLDRVHFCGLSMGGMIGMWLAVNAPHRLQKLALSNTAAKIGTAETWQTRIDTVQKHGMSAVLSAILDRWFTSDFREQHPAAVAPAERMILNSNTEGYIANCAAVRDFDYRDNLNVIRIPTLVIAGAHDPVTTPADGQFLARHIPGARLATPPPALRSDLSELRYVELPAAHISSIEAPSQFTTALKSFLAP